MTTPEPARGRVQRKRDTLTRLEDDRDAWVATASVDGTPSLVPLWFVWDRGALVMCTRRTAPTARNVTPHGTAVVTVGTATDVVHITGTAVVIEGPALEPESADAFAVKLGWDPRDLDAWVYIKITPLVVKAWREENEQPGRVLMRDGQWLD
ncbi:pyridoxamine 5'-phosphate oxidase family protein [Streptomyces sp. NPDC000410]|uniref:pyridoxamine 5'-phosphate oxidase family protein n=1 Tax=Streptomyces sp. NPDC000410 TaxID=3154254 RepID=UPI003329D3DB